MTNYTNTKSSIIIGAAILLSAAALVGHKEYEKAVVSEERAAVAATKRMRARLAACAEECGRVMRSIREGAHMDSVEPFRDRVNVVQTELEGWLAARAQDLAARETAEDVLSELRAASAMLKAHPKGDFEPSEALVFPVLQGKLERLAESLQ